jgi:hypothetical protein
LNLCVAEIIVSEDLWLLFKESRCSLVERDIGEDERFKELIHMFLEERLHVTPVEHAFEEFEAVEDYRIELLIFGSAGT